MPPKQTNSPNVHSFEMATNLVLHQCKVLPAVDLLVGEEGAASPPGTLEVVVGRAAAATAANSRPKFSADITALEGEEFVGITAFTLWGQRSPTSLSPLLIAVWTEPSSPEHSSYTSALQTAQFTWIHSPTPHGSSRPDSCTREQGGMTFVLYVDNHSYHSVSIPRM